MAANLSVSLSSKKSSLYIAYMIKMQRKFLEILRDGVNNFIP